MQPTAPRASLVDNFTEAILGGLLGGAVLGFFEAAWHFDPSLDLWLIPYAVGLYGLLGLPFGFAAGVAVTVLDRIAGKRWKLLPWLPFAAGSIFAVFPLLAFILHYLGNKVVYAEQGVPLTGKLAIVGICVVVAMGILVASRLTLTSRFELLRKPVGTLGLWIALLITTTVAALAMRPADPRESFGTGRGVPSGMEEAPNVLFVMVDTLRADHLGAYGGPVDTPTFDGIATDGIVFEQAFAQASWTRSSGASMFTSRLPSGHNADRKSSRLSESAVLWSEVLHDAGVSTGALVNNINLTRTFGFDQGFDAFLYESPSYRFGATESVFSLTWYKVVHKVAEKVLGGSDKRVEDYYQPADVVLADAQSFIEANTDARWGLYVHLMEPHDPYFEHPSIDGSGDAEYNGVGFARAEVEHPDPNDAEYLQRVYRDEVAFLDQKLAPFVAWLKESGNYDDTVIVITADHGEEFYEHGGWWHGTTLYDEQLHVPLIVKLADAEHGGTRVPYQVRSIDIAPTLAAAMGLDADESWDGSDLVADVSAWKTETMQAHADFTAAWIAENPEEDPATAPAMPEPAFDPCTAHPRDRLVIAEQDFEGNVLGAIRKDGFKYMTANEGNPHGLATEMFFHVLVDPDEQTDLIGGQMPCAVFTSDWSTPLETVVAAAASSGVDGGEVEETRAECEALVALGYKQGPCD